MNSPLAKSPIAWEIDVRRLPEKGMPVRISADARQRALLADIHDLMAVDSLEADLLVRAWRRDGVKVSGRVTAKIVQRCIVSLQPVNAEIDTDVEALFVPEGSRLARPELDEGGEILLSAEGPDAPEPFEGDRIDVGAVAEEFFALAIDPYPRAAGAEEAASYSTEAGSGGDEKPFAALRKLSKIRR
ncbi:MAG: DUF177 domain-containing protein [Rhizobiaceae bacterium]|nr:DUF177 domain-containing protein [Rhizobiaceae bacterium]MCV0405297.1 DUF177 domain-containing protein [Rhizobiaceae bacterium]